MTKVEFVNDLDESISLVEKSAKRLYPIYQELQRKIIQIKTASKKMEPEQDQDRADTEEVEG